MKLKRKLRTSYTIECLFNKYIVEGKVNPKHDLDFLIELVNIFREKDNKNTDIVSIEDLLTNFNNNPDNLISFKLHLNYLLDKKKFSRMISDAGIIQDSDFIPEIKKRLYAKILPYQADKDSLEYILNQVFYRHSDYKWVKKIPKEQILELLDLLEYSDIYTSAKDKSIISELLVSIGLITQRMSGRAMESYLIRMVPEYIHLESPFLAFENEFLLIEKNIRAGTVHYVSSDDLNYKQLMILHKQCLEFVDQAFKNSSKYGISMKVNQSLLRIRQQLMRVGRLIDVLVVDSDLDRRQKTMDLSSQLIEYNCYKNNVDVLIGESTQLISYEITQHTAKTGEHYITDSANEYWHMFKSSMGAGLIVGIMCIIKVLMSKVETSDFGFAFLYSLNYAVGFVIIYLMGFTLATKQPAMTAATIVKTIEEGLKTNTDREVKYIQFAKYFARLFRSQFIAFVGNVIIAFPVALLGVWLIDVAIDVNIVQSKWEHLLNDASPIHSLALIHAAIAGVFLFLSGIISGNISNRNKYNQVYYRIQEHPWLKRNLGENRTTSLANWVENKWPGIMSNVWFGIFMGSTGSIGVFLGLNIDIRHITFVSGNIAMGIYGSDFNASLSLLTWAFIGMFLIGAINFIVSFSLSLGLALRSRNVPSSEIKTLTIEVWDYFKAYSLEFFVPPVSPKSEKRNSEENDSEENDSEENDSEENDIEKNNNEENSTDESN